LSNADFVVILFQSGDKLFGNKGRRNAVFSTNRRRKFGICKGGISSKTLTLAFFKAKRKYLV
jgi:hypothetical protein